MAVERVTNELMHELPKRVQGDLIRKREDAHHRRGDVSILRQDVGGLVHSDLHRGHRFASTEARIERRLELTNGGEG